MNDMTEIDKLEEYNNSIQYAFDHEFAWAGRQVPLDSPFWRITRWGRLNRSVREYTKLDYPEAPDPNSSDDPYVRKSCNRIKTARDASNGNLSNADWDTKGSAITEFATLIDFGWAKVTIQEAEAMLATLAEFKKECEKAVSDSAAFLRTICTTVDLSAAASSSDTTIQELTNNICNGIRTMRGDSSHVNQPTTLHALVRHVTQLVRSDFIKETSQGVPAETLTKVDDLEEQWTKITNKFAELLAQFEHATGV